MERGRLKEVDVKAVGSKRVNMFRQRADQPRALPFAAGVHPRGILLPAYKEGVVAKALRARLVGHSHVVDGLLNFPHVLLILRVEQMEALAQKGPKRHSR